MLPSPIFSPFMIRQVSVPEVPSIVPVWLKYVRVGYDLVLFSTGSDLACFSFKGFHLA